MRFLAFFAFIVASVAASIAPAGAQSPDGMAAMQYYVGLWTCSAVGEPDSNSTATYTIENGVMRDLVVVPAQGKMTTPYQLDIVTVFDAKSGRYVQTSLDSLADWAVSFAKPFTGNAEDWTNTASSNGKLGRTAVARTDQNNFSINGYSTMAQTKPDFTVTCHRS